MLENLEIKDCKSVKRLIDSEIELVKDVYQGQVYYATKEQIERYQSFVGSLLWLACMTHPDIFFLVQLENIANMHLILHLFTIRP